MEDALFEAGCDDATISVRSGCVFLAFARKAGSLEDAILSALEREEGGLRRRRSVGESILLFRVQILEEFARFLPSKRASRIL
jgi:hypothetical protein